MSISIKNLVDKFNTAVAGSPTELQLMQLSIAANAISNVVSVSTSTQLPPAANNTGRLIYVDELKAYRYSDGTDWVSDFSSEINATLYSWGDNGSGELGTNNLTLRSSPGTITSSFFDWCQISTSERHNIAVRTNGTLWAWGVGNNGRLGDGTIVDKSSPVSVVGGFTNWCQVAAGQDHSVALRTNGTLWTWGDNNSGELGDGTTISKSSPVSVLGGFSDWCQVAAGESHTVAVRTNGTIWTWGESADGRLGNNTTADSSSPVSIVGGFTDWCQISTGFNHTLALRTNGTIWSWGANIFFSGGNQPAGQLGDGTTVNRSSPVSVVGGFTDWCQVSAGRYSSAAIRQNGTLWTWGRNNVAGAGLAPGQLGDGTTVDKSSPISVLGGFTDWCQVSSGHYHRAAIRTNGTLWAWGDNDNGQLGDGTTVNKCSPVSVLGGISSWSKVDLGRNHSLALNFTKGF